MTPRQLAVYTLKQLARRCMHDQWRLRKIRLAQRVLAADEKRTLDRITQSKNRIDRELLVSGPLLGVPKSSEDGDNDFNF